MSAHHDTEEIEPQPQALYDVGVAVKVLKMMRPAQGEQSEVTIIVHGLARIRVKQFTQKDPYYKAQIEQVTEMLRPMALNQFDAAAKTRDELETAVGSVAEVMQRLHAAVSLLATKKNPFTEDCAEQTWTATIAVSYTHLTLPTKA